MLGKEQGNPNSVLTLSFEELPSKLKRLSKKSKSVEVDYLSGVNEPDKYDGSWLKQMRRNRIPIWDNRVVEFKYVPLYQILSDCRSRKDIESLLKDDEKMASQYKTQLEVS